ncbi:hypothetical protein M1N86_02165 [Dehalococcoidia bacterium]|nr:hypothetical protein [Dehalococcoidia bacterium]
MHIAEVSSGLIIDVLTSPTFKRALSKAGSRTRRTGHETCFTVMKKYASDDFGVPSVTEGASGMMWDGGLLEEIYCVSKRRFFDLLSHSYSLFHIHFHSSYGHPIRPSLADMYAIHSKFIDSTYESGEDRLYEHVYEVRMCMAK